MRKKKSSGPVRMKELGRKKVEVWLSERQMEAFEKFCKLLGLPKATMARRAINHAVEGGQHAAYPLTNGRYD